MARARSKWAPARRAQGRVFLFTHAGLLPTPSATINADFGQAGRYQLAGTVTAVPA